MIKIKVIDRDGSEKEIDAKSGITLMEALRDNGIDSVLALCGGCCSCATCHVFIEKGPKSLVGTASEDEDDLLETSESRRPSSRLSCQIELENHIEELTVEIAPED
ncbi:MULTISPECIES: 2Fe-2S iron-sulfur cluster-binding protein [Citromicrobium]|uniref:2Fe-2S iron-sulfur cluster-binding protein n=1 Tax=Citromicrobium TaxID=72173 RepID=UPI0001DD0A3A|nr:MULTISPECIES: 2Fe-2S iron-sulfur cluster-binding protein [Citromicrobium]